MLILRSVIATTLLLLSISIPLLAASRRQNVDTLLRRADRLYAEKTFGAAADTYERALKTDELSAQRKDAVEYRFDEALGKAKRWDRALTEGVGFVQRHRGTVWEAWGLYWLGRVTLGAPHQGWSVGKRFVRGNNAPTGKFAERPVYRQVQDQDLRNARDAFEAARILYPTYRSSGPAVSHEEIQLDFDLARVLRSGESMGAWASRRAWAPPADPSWQVDPAAAYSIGWAPPRKLMFLFESAFEVAGPDRRQAALVLLGKAIWLSEYHALMSRYAFVWKDGEIHRIPYPYQSVTSVATLQDLLHNPRTADDSVRDIASLTLASLLAQDNRMTEADRELTRFLRERPGSPWAATARRNLSAVRHGEISVSPSEPVQLPGSPVRIRVTYRNADRIRIHIFRLRLPDLFRRYLSRKGDLDAMLQVESLLGPKQRAEESGPLLATREFSPAFRGVREPHQQALSLPIKTPGAYLVEASTSGVSAANVVIVSDLALVRKAHRDGVLFFATHAGTGAPISGVKVVAIQSWPTDHGNRFVRSSGVTGPDGLVTIPYTRVAKQDNLGNLQVRAFAYRGDRYAVESDDASRPDEATQAFSVYGLTDRAVYRPGQKVHYRLVVMRNIAGRLRPAVGAHVQVVINAPAGNVILTRSATCGPFGTLHDGLDLRPDAALGNYSVSTTVGGDPSSGVSPLQFQVEEYKKPEFEVTVAPAQAQVLMGETATARITAHYYFGGPVPNARVKYRIFRDNGWFGYRFPHDYDSLYGNSDQSGPFHGFHNQQPVEQRETRTDSQGTATITFATKGSGLDPRVLDPGYSNADYTVEAEVQDASRRVIAGSGTVLAVGRGLAITLEARLGYFHTGEAVEVDVVGVDPSNSPLPASGVVTVVSNPNGPKKWVKEVLRQPFRTAADGKGRFAWRPAKAGHYSVTFVTHDPHGLEVKGETDVWIAGPDLASGDLRNRTVELVAERPYYTEGQIAHVLLVTPSVGCTVLLTREAGSVILDKRLVTVSGRTMELSLPIHTSDSPEITLAAVLVRDRQMYSAQAEIRVPPVSQLASVTLQPDRARYQPGQTATVHLAARDYRGRPLHAEMSLGISDASLDYIQENNVADIRSNLFARSGGMNGPDASLDSQFQERVADAHPEPSDERGPNRPPPTGMGLLTEWPDLSQYPGLVPGYLDRTPNGGFVQTPGHSRRRWIYQGDTGVYRYAGGMGSMGTRDSFNVGWYNSDSLVPIYESSRASFATGDVLGVDTQVTGGVNLVAGATAGEPQMMARMGAISGRAGRVDMNAVLVRRLFADTALWAPAVVTDTHGNATIRVTWPDNLTRWRARAVAVGAGGEVGNVDATVETKKDLLVRLSAPRFVVERDMLTLSATVQNALPRAAQVRVRLKLGSNNAELDPTTEPGAESTRLEKTGDLRAQMRVRSTTVLSRQGVSTPGSASASLAETTIEVPASGEKRVDWSVRAQKAGQLPVTVTALSNDASDAMQVSLPVLIHGAERVVTQAGVLRDQNPYGQNLRDQNQSSQNRVELLIETPGDNADPNAEVVVRLQPSLAVVALDALPYLIDDPYGCVEQTLSRFLPAVVVRKTLNDLGYHLKDLRRRATTARQAPAHPGVRRTPNSPYTAPSTPLDAAASPPVPLPGERAASPVFRETRLHAVVASSLQRLTAMQHEDGGWGWWTHDNTDAYMTAYVVYGLLMARSAGTSVDAELLSRGLGALRNAVADEREPQRLAFEVRVLAMDPKSRDRVRAIATGRLFSTREKLCIYSKALLALALHDLGHDGKAALVLQNIEDAARIDADAGTVTWEETEAWWRWYNDAVETHAAVLEAYLAIQPTHRLVPMIAQWLAREREGVHWSSTKETALAVLALTRYALANREMAPNYTVAVSCGRTHRSFRVTSATALFFDGRLTLRGAALHGGDRLTITKSGPGTLYYTVTSRVFSQEEPLQPVAGDLAVERRYYRLIPTASTPVPKASVETTAADGPDRANPFVTGRYDLVLEVGDSEPDSSDSPAYRREPLVEGEVIASGDLIEVALQLKSRQDFEYLVLEDIKPAGCEPVDLQSGEEWEPGVYSNRELRDQKVAFFLEDLAAGSRLLTYRLYAEIPGRFHVLPTNAYAMYAPRVRALSSEGSLQIR